MSTSEARLERHLQLSSLEAALWDEVFSPHLSSSSSSADDPPLTVAGIGKVLRRVDRVFGRSNANDGMGGKMVGQDEVIKRYNDIVHDRTVLRRLSTSPGIEQRTPEWYAAREGLITASDFAQALGHGKFATQKDFFVKKVEPGPFQSSPALKWGVMFEPVASDIYRARNGGIKMYEFGLLRHPRLSHVGASPDGITDAGIMVEIKCPYQRKINREVPYRSHCRCSLP